MKGFRTLAINAAVVIGTSFLTWAAGVDWTQHVSPTVAMVVLGVVNMALRWITTTPVAQAS